MAYLIQPVRIRYLDSHGRRVPKGTPGARKRKEKSDRWYGGGIVGKGNRLIPLALDKEVAQRKLNALVIAAERGDAGMIDRDATARPLKVHLEEFEQDLAAGLRVGTGRKRRTAPKPQQVALVVQRIRDVLNGCGFRFVDDLKTGARKLARYLDGRVNKPRAEGGISHQTATFLLAEAKRFARWIARQGTGVAPDVFDSVAGFDPANERTHARREIIPGELAKVLDAAKASAQTVRGLTGPDRYHVYLVAFSTGFRASELGELTPGHFHLDTDPPSVSLPGKVAKNRKTVRPPLPAAVAIALRSYLETKPANQPVWPGQWKRHAAKMLRIDLKAAGVPYAVRTPHGTEHADFHSLRHSFVTALAASGAGAKALQTLARHSDPRLTLNLYTHARSAELVETVERLQVPGSGPKSPLASMDRQQLERLTLGLLVMLGTILAPSGTAGAVGGAVTVESRGDSGGRLDTSAAKRRKG